jgi:hypothetical protein
VTDALYLQLLALTLVIELALVLVLAPRFARRRLLVDALILNLITHPTATMLHGAGLVPFTTVELGVIAAEAAGFAGLSRLPLPVATALSVTINGATIAVSWVL